MEITAEKLYDVFSSYDLKNLTKLFSDGFSGIFLVLKSLLNKNKEHTAGDISSSLNVSTARVAAMLKTLVKKGYVKKEKSSQDARKTIVNITKIGENALLQRKREVFGLMDNYLSKLDEKDSTDLLRIITKIFK